MLQFVPGVHLPAHLSRADALWLVFQGSTLLVCEDSTQSLFPEVRDIGWFGFAEAKSHYLGLWNDRPVFTMAAAAADIAPSGYYFEDFRKLLSVIELDVFGLAGRAFQILEWERNHRFCGRCGTPTSYHASERAVICPSCAFTQYPRINPCVIVVVTRGEELLLARSTRFNRPMYSALAGFVEAGETVEETLAREVKEEVGIEVRDLRYFGSQPWPFPNNLMLGFLAEYASGELVLQEDEILDAQFFHHTRLPNTPPPGSIAHALIQEALKRFS